MVICGLILRKANRYALAETGLAVVEVVIEHGRLE
jgi:hypothetical protein